MVLGPKVILKLQESIETSDGLGGITKSWSDTNNIKGVLQSAKGDENFIIGKKTVISTHHFYCDYNKNIIFTEKKRFTFRSRIFEIIFVDNIDYMDKYYKLYLLEVK